MLVILALALFVGADVALASSERDLTDKRVLVTGTNELGISIAEKCLANGAGLVIYVGKNQTFGEAAVAPLVDQYGSDKVVFWNYDVAVQEDLDEAYEKVKELCGALDVLIHSEKFVNEFELPTAMATDLIGPMKWTLKFAADMRNDTGGNGGTILYMNSLAATETDPFLINYSTSMQSLRYFSDSMGHRYNYRETGVRHVTVCPGLINYSIDNTMTPWKVHAVDLQRRINTMPVQEVAPVSDGAIYVFQNADTGTAWQIFGGATPSLVGPDTYFTLEDIDALPPLASS